MSFIGNNPKWNSSLHRPQSVIPSNPTDGMVYWDDGTNQPSVGLYQYNGGIWEKLATAAVSNINVTSQSSTYTALTTDDLILCSGASWSLTLFTAVGNTGKQITIKHNGTNLTQVYTLLTTGGQTIGGIASGSYALYTNGETLKLVSDGSNWVILEHVTQTAWISAGTVPITATTTNPTKSSSIIKDAVTWKRDGAFATIQIEYAQLNTTGAAIGSGDYLFGLPLTMDTSNMDLFTTVVGTGAESLHVSQIGYGNWHVTADNFNCQAVPYDSTKIRVYYLGTGSGGMIASGGGAGLTAIEWRLSMTIIAPISGWRP